MANDAEQYVFEICRRTFLSLWSYPNPLGKQSKELCDILVVCGDKVVIISVKDIQPTSSGDIGVDIKRWLKRAIVDSAKQTYGAERWLQQANHFTSTDGSDGLPLPPIEQRKVHRIAIAFGGEGQMPLQQGDFGKGFVHVLDRTAFDTMLSELDTVSDFLKYLHAKEMYFSRNVRVLFEGQEEDLLAFYIFNGRTFPAVADVLVVGNDWWREVRGKPEFVAKKRVDKISYLWDTLIEAHIRGLLERIPDINPDILDAEPALRELALEDRYCRRMLSNALDDFLDQARAGIVASRLVRSPERSVSYVFLPARPEEDREYRMAELAGRCWVARDHVRDCHTVIGLAVGELERDHPLDLFYLYKPDWTEEDQRRAKEAREGLGFFEAPVERKVSEDEYPKF